jgi:hypothetical protein
MGAKLNSKKFSIFEPFITCFASKFANSANTGCIAPVVCSFLSTTAQLYATHRKGGERRKRHSNNTRE